MLRKLVAGDEVDEAVLLSTCNRVELVVLTREIEAARLRLRSLFRRELAPGGAGPAEQDLDDCLYEYQNGDAMRHVLRVASSLDSMVVGEPQILGQAKDAYRAAVECGAAGPILGRLFQHAFATAKRVRSETRIAERPVSVARVAVDLAAQIFESFSEKRALLVGAGEMIELALRALRGAGLEAIAVANRTAERAARLAVQFGATAHGLDELPALIADADVVLTSIGGGRAVADASRRGARAALAARPPDVRDRHRRSAQRRPRDRRARRRLPLRPRRSRGDRERERRGAPPRAGAGRGDRGGGAAALRRLVRRAARGPDDPAAARARGGDPRGRGGEGAAAARARRRRPATASRRSRARS